MNYILLHWNFGRPSMRMVVERMQEKCNLLLKRKSGDWVEESQGGVMWRPLDGKKGASVMEILRDDSNNVINWGNRIFGNGDFFSVNSPNAVGLASNKSRCREILQKAGVKVPKTRVLDSYAILPVMEYPVIGRPPFHHGGSDFHVIDSEKDFFQFIKNIDLGWYFSEVFEKTHEYRLHVFHGKVAVIQEKPLIAGEIRGNFAVTHENWRILKWSEYHRNMCVEAAKAVLTLGLDYGAVDMLHNSKNDSFAVCEVNTSPTINSPYMSEKYAAYFDWLIRHDFPDWFAGPNLGETFYSKDLRS